MQDIQVAVNNTENQHKEIIVEKTHKIGKDKPEYEG